MTPRDSAPPQAGWRIGQRIYHPDSPDLQQALAAAHGSGLRPRCLCVAHGVPMVVARLGQFVLKRMPDSGQLHHPACPSFSPAPALSGLAPLMGGPVVERPTGEVEIRADFAWQSRGRALARQASGGPSTVVRALDRRISLQALLHLLLERAGLNRWQPAAPGRGDQAELRRRLTSAAEALIVNGQALAARLFVPEPFSRDTMVAAAQRRRAHLRFLHANDGEALALLVGEFKSLEEVEYGRRLWIRHMPDAPVLVRDIDWERIGHVFGDVLAARDADLVPAPRVLAALLVRTRMENLYEIEAICLTLTTPEWIPLAHGHELPLIAELVASGRSFIKPLHYDAPSPGAYPNALLLDAGAQPLRLDVVSPLVSPRDRHAKERALGSCGVHGWLWRTDGPMPPLPPVVRQ